MYRKPYLNEVEMDTQNKKEEKKNPSEEENLKNPCRATRNTLLFLFAAAAVGTVVYFAIKEGQRIKAENELLDYEVW